MDSNKKEVKRLVKEMLKWSRDAMVKKLDKVLASAAVDLENWEREDAPMKLPKCIVVALLEYEVEQYSARGTSFEKQVKKDIARIKDAIRW